MTILTVSKEAGKLWDTKKFVCTESFLRQVDDNNKETIM